MAQVISLHLLAGRNYTIIDEGGSGWYFPAHHSWKYFGPPSCLDQPPQSGSISLGWYPMHPLQVPWSFFWNFPHTVCRVARHFSEKGACGAGAGGTGGVGEGAGAGGGDGLGPVAMIVMSAQFAQICGVCSDSHLNESK